MTLLPFDRLSENYIRHTTQVGCADMAVSDSDLSELVQNETSGIKLILHDKKVRAQVIDFSILLPSMKGT